MELQTQAHLPMLRQLLLYRQTELRAEVHAAQLARQRQAEQGDNPEVSDLKDGAERMQRQQTEDFQAGRDLRELQDVDDALGRLDAGTYGDCADCGEAISVARLQALPFARLCAGCQAAREHRA
ncbi:MAG: TraR/DksA family transcriptional regulator [Roseateles sp.]|uniref:TraR/DksA family transcriptional regulator n=1 Tax=Roseateles sp. TaxID=1971397 RepID=UPI0040360AEB